MRGDDGEEAGDLQAGPEPKCPRLGVAKATGPGKSGFGLAWLGLISGDDSDSGSVGEPTSRASAVAARTTLTLFQPPPVSPVTSSLKASDDGRASKPVQLAFAPPSH